MSMQFFDPHPASASASAGPARDEPAGNAARPNRRPWDGGKRETLRSTHGSLAAAVRDACRLRSLAESMVFPDAALLRKYAGIAPITERSGNKSSVRGRYRCPTFLRQTFIERLSRPSHAPSGPLLSTPAARLAACSTTLHSALLPSSGSASLTTAGSTASRTTRLAICSLSGNARHRS
jgi:hypothetical protein